MGSSAGEVGVPPARDWLPNDTGVFWRSWLAGGEAVAAVVQ